MPADETARTGPRASALPMWFRIAVAGISVLVLTAVLRLVHPVFPIGEFPMPYILLAALVAYLLGDWPALAALLLGFVAFSTYAHPRGAPIGSREWAALVTYAIVGIVGVLAMLAVQRRRERLLQAAQELSDARALAEQSERRLSAILQNTGDAILLIDPDHRIAYANDAARVLLSREVACGETFECLTESCRARETEGAPTHHCDLTIDKALDQGISSETTVLVDGESGSETIVSLRASPICGSEGSIDGAVAVLRNITSKWTEDQAIRRSEELYRNLVQVIPHGVAEIDVDGTMRYTNPAFCSMHGYADGDLTGRHVWEVLTAESETELRQIFSRLVAEQPPPFLDISKARTKDGRTIDVQVSWNYRRDREGQVAGFTIVAADVTEQVRARKELERSYEREHRIAETLQASLMRPIPHRIDGLAFEKLYRAALDEARVGGDFYDVFDLGGGKIALAIGDVSGKGLHAAVQVAAAKYSLRGRAYESTNPAEILEQVNRTLVQDMDTDSFTSIFFGIVDCPTKKLRYANAGHAPVMLWRLATGTPMLFEPTGPVAGMDTDVQFEEATIQLEPGDEILMGTDGLYEMRCRGSFLEVGELLEIYRKLKQEGSHSASALVDKVVAHCGEDLRDDVAILRVTVEG